MSRICLRKADKWEVEATFAASTSFMPLEEARRGSVLGPVEPRALEPGGVARERALVRGRDTTELGAARRCEAVVRAEARVRRDVARAAVEPRGFVGVGGRAGSVIERPAEHGGVRDHGRRGVR